MDLTPFSNEQHRAELHTELTRRGLPRAYIERLLSELDDHLIDLLQERNPTMGAARKLQIESDDPQQRLGDPTQLAIFAADQYHSRTFWGRHPIVTFLLAPLPLLVSVGVTYVFALWLLVSLPSSFAYWLTGSTRVAADHLYLQAIMFTLFTWGLFVLPPLVTALLLCRTYRRNALSVRWPLAGCTLLAMLAAFLHYSWRLDTHTGDGLGGAYTIGFTIRASLEWFALTFMPKFALAFGIGLLLIKRAQQKLERENAESPLPSGNT